MLDKNNLPPFEDIVKIYLNNTNNNLFPKKCKNKSLVYIIGFFHLIGALVLSYGVLLPPRLLPLYLIYCLVNIILYYIFKQRCFMTLLTNYYSGGKGDALQIRMDTHFRHMGLNIVLAIIGIINPDWSFFYLLGKIFCKC